MNAGTASIPPGTIAASLVNRVEERAARSHSAAGIPLIVLDELLTTGEQIHEEEHLEFAKRLLVAAHRSAGSNSSASDDACVT